MPGTAVARGAVSTPVRARAQRIVADPRTRQVLGILLLAALYRAVAEIGFALQFAGPIAAIAWLPVGVGIAFLYVNGLRYWPGVLLGDLIANDYGALPLGSAVGQTIGNVLEVLVATIVLQRLARRRDPLGSVAGVGGMLAAIAAGTAVSATVGSLALWAGDVIQSHHLAGVWRTWWLGDASGALIVVPLALAWARRAERWEPLRIAEGALVLAVIASLSAIALRSSETLTYVVFPALMWAALRLGRRGATLAVAAAAGFAIWETTRRQGPFAFDSITGSVLATQLYLAVSAITTLCVAAVAAERRAFEQGLRGSRARLVDAAAAERRRIGSDLHDGLQQRLTALLVRLQMAEERAQADPDTAPARLQSAGIELSAAIDELRELAHGIHPSVVTDQGLARALQGMAGRSALRLRLLELPSTRVGAAAEVTAYFLVSEAVTNARKHSGATQVDVRVSASHGWLHVEISDDGLGGASERDGTGILGLRDRVEAFGGTLELSSPAGEGTRLLAELPAGR